MPLIKAQKVLSRSGSHSSGCQSRPSLTSATSPTSCISPTSPTSSTSPSSTLTSPPNKAAQKRAVIFFPVQFSTIKVRLHHHSKGLNHSVIVNYNSYIIVRETIINITQIIKRKLIIIILKPVFCKARWPYEIFTFASFYR